ncbi:hypothetical protein [Kribbella sp. NPDC004875]|uniref:MmyB family transcriptional regulator n=1 Tax=Kribbella sp. NPDC004875 TaxID=3364107 RepID=UPI0036B41828
MTCAQSPRRVLSHRARSTSGHTQKIVEHPEVGDIAVDSNVLTTQNTNLRIIVDTPRDAEARSKLALL